VSEAAARARAVLREVVRVVDVIVGTGGWRVSKSTRSAITVLTGRANFSHPRWGACELEGGDEEGATRKGDEGGREATRIGSMREARWPDTAAASGFEGNGESL
jgi:hypothetical protein